jgi:predicted lipoprotein with Yx(FWY)xxD motif
MRKAPLILPLLLVVVVAGCGASAGQPASSAAAAAKHATVKTRHGTLGTFLVDGSGRTLYRFMHDKSAKSTCSGACAANWPPLTSREKAEAEGKAKASLISSHKRAGGAKQVIYHGRPLYHFSGDSAAGQTNGEGINAFGGRWYVVSPAGKPIKATAAAAPAPSSTPSPYPY